MKGVAVCTDNVCCSLPWRITNSVLDVLAFFIKPPMHFIVLTCVFFPIGSPIFYKRHINASIWNTVEVGTHRATGINLPLTLENGSASGLLPRPQLLSISSQPFPGDRITGGCQFRPGGAEDFFPGLGTVVHPPSRPCAGGAQWAQLLWCAWLRAQTGRWGTSLLQGIGGDCSLSKASDWNDPHKAIIGTSLWSLEQTAHWPYWPGPSNGSWSYFTRPAPSQGRGWQHLWVRALSDREILSELRQWELSCHQWTLSTQSHLPSHAGAPDGEDVT